MYIESVKNPSVKTWTSLKTKKGRASQRSFLAEGLRLTEEALRSNRQVECLLLDAAADDDFLSLRNLATAKGVPVYELSPQAFAAVSDTVTPQGVIAIVSQPDTAVECPAYALLLDGVQNPGNVGTLLRTADAFGVQEVCCSTDSADVFAPKVVRASMGGLFRLSVHRLEAGDYIRAWAKQWPDGNIVVSEAGGQTACHEVPFRTPSLVVVGSEATGVSDEVRELATIRTYIPMTANVESLNASVAGSIVLYESFRQRQ